jgi:type II secretory ATPase GspE/PulE/Tfp pilus assembly ATPase PilB-like protein
MLLCNEKHKFILKIKSLPSLFGQTTLLAIMSKNKRIFESEKCTFARFNCSHVDQTRRRKAGIGSSLPGILPGLCHEANLIT